jgi:hypothetical protein
MTNPITSEAQIQALQSRIRRRVLSLFKSVSTDVKLPQNRDRMILFGEASLRRVLREYVAHFHSERNHQSLGNQLLEPLATVSTGDEPIQCPERLGGMLNFYYREAA